MDGWMVVTGAMLFCASTMANAQANSRASDPVFARAQAMVSDGNGAAGRALIDSMIAATPTGAPLYPQALFWRASLGAHAPRAGGGYWPHLGDHPLPPPTEKTLPCLGPPRPARGG